MIMANKRNLKKAINYIAGELFTECVVLKDFVPGTDNEKVTSVMAKVLAMQDEMLSRISHPEPGNIKGFYKKLYADLHAQVDSIADEISSLQ